MSTPNETSKQTLIIVGLLVAAAAIIFVPQLFYFRALALVCLVGALAAMFYPQVKKMFKQTD